MHLLHLYFYIEYVKFGFDIFNTETEVKQRHAWKRQKTQAHTEATCSLKVSGEISRMLLLFNPVQLFLFPVTSRTKCSVHGLQDFRACG